MENNREDFRGLSINEGDLVKELRWSLNEGNFPRLVFILERETQEYAQTFQLTCPGGFDQLRLETLLKIPGRKVEKISIVNTGIKIDFEGGLFYFHGYKPLEANPEQTHPVNKARYSQFIERVVSYFRLIAN